MLNKHPFENKQAILRGTTWHLLFGIIIYIKIHHVVLWSIYSINEIYYITLLIISL